MNISDESVGKFKEIFKKESGKELSDVDARASAENLVGFFSLLMKLDREDRLRKRRLKKEPDGFPIEGIRMCFVCHQNVGPEKNWYAQWGITCLLCLRAIKDGVVPPFVCIHGSSCYQASDLKDAFGIHPQTARKMVRMGELKARIVTTTTGTPYHYIFLKKENPQLVDPKRDSPSMKSWKRNRDKVLDRQIREAKKKSLTNTEKGI